MKKLLLSLIGILCSMSMWAATVNDLVAINQNYTLIADDVTTNGTVAISKNTLFGDSHFLSTTDLSVSTSKGSSTINSISHLNSLRIKNNVYIAFKVSGACHVKVYHQSNSSRTVIISNQYKLNEGDVVGSYSTTTTEADIAGAQTVYIYSIDKDNAASGKGDLYIAGIEITGFASTKTPSFSTDLASAYDALTNKAQRLSVVASDYTSLTWYEATSTTANPDTDTQLGTGASYDLNKTTAGTYYIYCRAYNMNATGEKYANSTVATITVNEPGNYAVTWSNTNGWGLQSVKAGNTTLQNGAEVEAGTQVTFTASIGAGHTLVWYVNGVENAEKTGTLNVTIYKATVVEARYRKHFKFTFSDNSKMKAYAALDGKITLSANNFSYQDGKVVDYWTDASSNHYVVGTEYTLTQDVELTPHFVDNIVALGDAATTATWDFGYKTNNTGSPVFTSLQGSGNTGNYVTQATVLGKKVDVNLEFDASSGKIDNERRVDAGNSQVNGGTTLTVPVLENSVVTIDVTGSLAVSGDGKKSATSISTGSLTLSNSDKTGKYTATTAGNLTITIGSNAGYVSSISVTYPDLSNRKYATWTADKTGNKTELTLSSKTTEIDNTSNLSDISLNGALKKEGDSNTNASIKITTTTTKVDANFISMTFDVADGYKFTPSLVCPKVVSVSTVKTYEVEMTDGVNTVTFDPVQATSTDAAGEIIYLMPSNAETLSGTVTVKMWVYGATNHYRIADFKVAGTTAFDGKQITINSTGISSCVTNIPLDFTDVDGVTCYVVENNSALNTTEGTLTVTPVKKVNVGAYFIKGTPGNHNVPVLTGDAEDYTNIIAGSTSSTFTATNTTYALSANDGMLHPVTEGTVIPANIAYLNLATSARSLRIVYGETTGIKAVNAEKVANAKFIENGRIVIVKDGAKYNVAGQVIK